MKRIGVLALQGSVAEHLAMLTLIPGVEAAAVKTKTDLAAVDGIILPGGESTTIGKLLRDFRMIEPLQDRIAKGMPVWGTCAGMILLARDIVGEKPYMPLMDIQVKRNAYGRQIDSFSSQAIIPAIGSDPIDLVFIRAPWIEAVTGPMDWLAGLDGRLIAARQNHMLVTSFHPELTKDPSIHRYFAGMVADKGFLC
ncbi:MAG: pyridoxal 5'-phosphate synthase glutaminase subunit PdxT [Clostridiaceae bacterium]|nr:pyridoxal 5'-phosphate synthase glutaminase subunit PdxT [Clostridiaceae bacterium]